jgi:hypothetical protein
VCSPASPRPHPRPFPWPTALPRSSHGVFRYRCAIGYRGANALWVRVLAFAGLGSLSTEAGVRSSIYANVFTSAMLLLWQPLAELSFEDETHFPIERTCGYRWAVADQMTVKHDCPCPKDFHLLTMATQVRTSEVTPFETSVRRACHAHRALDRTVRDGITRPRPGPLRLTVPCSCLSSVPGGPHSALRSARVGVMNARGCPRDLTQRCRRARSRRELSIWSN